MIKKAWISEAGGSRDLFVLSIRQHPNALEMVHNDMDLPPTEQINGKQIGIDEAVRLNLVEKHHTLGVFTTEDLEKLHRAIGKVLYE